MLVLLRIAVWAIVAVSTRGDHSYQHIAVYSVILGWSNPGVGTRSIEIPIFAGCHFCAARHRSFYAQLAITFVWHSIAHFILDSIFAVLGWQQGLCIGSVPVTAC